MLHTDIITADVRGNRILVCPLNWGLGHATRCVPIVRALIKSGKTVIIAADGEPLAFLQQEFPHIETIYFGGLTVKYANGTSQIGAMLRQLPKFAYQIWREHRKLAEIIDKNNIDTIISDNRFGLWNKQIRCIYITHQLMIKMPIKWRFLESVVWRMHRWFIRHYHRCWIPDEAEDGLSGDLAHKYPIPENGVFIGILSRFENTFNNENLPPSPYNTIALISGPEPQRTLFEKQIVELLRNNNYASLVVRGMPATVSTKQIGQITIVNHLDSNHLEQLLRTTPHIICRSGYTTLMDLTTLQRTATLVPTPGQTEQEYLADYVRQFGFNLLSQA
ncbi:MAG: glycosyltransferase family protein [Paludibacteraceae bacterium]